MPGIAAADTPATPAPSISLRSDYTRGQVEAALAMSEFAVGTGYKTAASEQLSFKDIGIIQETAAKLGKFAPAAEAETSAASVSVAEWVAFEAAYYRLAAALSPVTAETLAATAAMTLDADAGWRDRILGSSPALRFTRMFSLISICFGAFVIVTQCLVYVWGLQTDESVYRWEKNLAESLLPWAYGALGSCAYLLRSAHYFIYERSFDLRRKPEYFNRILLGAISGGAIILFVNYLVDDGGEVLHLSAAALGFVAGYSTDFLFNTIERVIAAIFPKTDSDPKAQPPAKANPRQAIDTPDDDGPPGGGDGGNGGDASEERDTQDSAKDPAKKDLASRVKPAQPDLSLLAQTGDVKTP